MYSFYALWVWPCLINLMELIGSKNLKSHHSNNWPIFLTLSIKYHWYKPHLLVDYYSKERRQFILLLSFWWWSVRYDIQLRHNLILQMSCIIFHSFQWESRIFYLNNWAWSQWYKFYLKLANAQERRYH